MEFYPAIFEEPTYAIEEINLYTRLLAICQPVSILPWQLTYDYSQLAGGGIFGDNEPLHPTQRFWNLKQLASTPKGLSAMPMAGDRPNISCAALGNNPKTTYAFHFVNRGATNEATITGLPVKLEDPPHFYHQSGGGDEGGASDQRFRRKRATIHLPSMTYTTLRSDRRYILRIWIHLYPKNQLIMRLRPLFELQSLLALLSLSIGQAAIAQSPDGISLPGKNSRRHAGRRIWIGDPLVQRHSLRPAARRRPEMEGTSAGETLGWGT